MKILFRVGFSSNGNPIHIICIIGCAWSNNPQSKWKKPTNYDNYVCFISLLYSGTGKYSWCGRGGRSDLCYRVPESPLQTEDTSVCVRGRPGQALDGLCEDAQPVRG